MTATEYNAMQLPDGGRLHILTAMPREAQSLGLSCEVIGIGATDLPEIGENDAILNIGYCGSNGIPVGTIIEPNLCVDMRSGEAIPLHRHFEGLCRSAACFTSDTFVTEASRKEPTVYDMELFWLAKIPCHAIYVLKIVSDNLNERDCEEFDGKESWKQVREILAQTGIISREAIEKKPIRGRKLKGETRRVPITVHAPLDQIARIERHIAEKRLQEGYESYSRSDFYHDAAEHYLVSLDESFPWLISEYKQLLKEIGYSNLLDLAEDVKYALKHTTDLEEKVKLLRQVQKNIRGTNLVPGILDKENNKNNVNN